MTDRVLFWDRQNNPIEDTLTWARMLEDAEQRIVAVDADEERDVMVSTIWEGIDRGYSLSSTPETVLIFETAHIRAGKVVETFLAHTEEEALEKHAVICLTALKREARPEDGLRERAIENDRWRPSRAAEPEPEPSAVWIGTSLGDGRIIPEPDDGRELLSHASTQTPESSE